jgi:hypothetical protein
VGQKAWLINRLWTGAIGSQESIDYNLSQNDKNNMKRKQAGGQKFASNATYNSLLLTLQYYRWIVGDHR